MGSGKPGRGTTSPQGIALIVAGVLEILGASSRPGREDHRSAHLIRAARELRALATSSGDPHQIRDKGLAALDLATREVQVAQAEFARRSRRGSRIKEVPSATPFGEVEITQAEMIAQSEALLGDLMGLRNLLTASLGSVD
jgi:hypothetical protein